MLGQGFSEMQTKGLCVCRHMRIGEQEREQGSLIWIFEVWLADHLSDVTAEEGGCSHMVEWLEQSKESRAAPTLWPILSNTLEKKTDQNKTLSGIDTEQIWSIRNSFICYLCLV